MLTRPVQPRDIQTTCLARIHMGGSQSPESSRPICTQKTAEVPVLRAQLQVACVGPLIWQIGLSGLFIQRGRAAQAGSQADHCIQVGTFRSSRLQVMLSLPFLDFFWSYCPGASWIQIKSVLSIQKCIVVKKVWNQNAWIPIPVLFPGPMKWVGQRKYQNLLCKGVRTECSNM